MAKPPGSSRPKGGAQPARAGATSKGRQPPKGGAARTTGTAARGDRPGQGTATSSRPSASASAGAGSASRLMLPCAGLLIGLWAVVPPYAGPSIANLASKVEFADHVVPGVLVIVLSLVSLVIGRRSTRSTGLLFAAGLGVVLAGLWMISTHLPLVPQARRGEVAWGPVLYHSTPGLAVLALGVVWAMVHRGEAEG